MSGAPDAVAEAIRAAEARAKDDPGAAADMLAKLADAPAFFPWGAFSLVKFLMQAGRRSQADGWSRALFRRFPQFVAGWVGRLELSCGTPGYGDTCAAVAEEMRKRPRHPERWLLRSVIDCALGAPEELRETLIGAAAAGGIVDAAMGEEIRSAARLLAGVRAALGGPAPAGPHRAWSLGLFGGAAACRSIDGTLYVDLSRLRVRALARWNSPLAAALVEALHFAAGLVPFLDDRGLASWGHVDRRDAAAAVLLPRLVLHAATHADPADRGPHYAAASLARGELWVRAGNVELWALWNHLVDPQGAGAVAEQVAERAAAAAAAGAPFAAGDDWWPRTAATQNIVRLMTNAGWYARPGHAATAFADWADRYAAALTEGNLLSGHTSEILRVGVLAPGIVRRQPRSWSDRGIVALLSDARVVFVTAFPEAATTQFENGAIEAIWGARTGLPPPRSLRTLPAPMTIWPYAPRGSWSEDLAALVADSARAVEEERATVFVASCGAYGLPLVHAMHRRFAIACVYYGHAMNMYFGVYTDAFADAPFFVARPDGELWLPVDLARRHGHVARIDDGRYVAGEGRVPGVSA